VPRFGGWRQTRRGGASSTARLAAAGRAAQEAVCSSALSGSASVLSAPLPVESASA